MKELKHNGIIHLKEFDVDIKPYLTMAEMDAICTEMLETDNYFEREAKLISGVVSFACEDIKEGTDIDLLLDCGLWNMIQYHLFAYIEKIKSAMHYYDSVNYTLNSLTKNADDLMKSIEVLKENNEAQDDKK